MNKKTGNKKVVTVSIIPFQIVLTLLLQAVLPAVLHVGVHSPPGRESGKSRVLPIYQYLHKDI